MTDIVPHLCTGVKVVIAQIKHQFNYLYFSRNINGLKDEAIKLEAVIQGFQEEVNDAMDNLQEIDPEVTTLLSDFDNFKNEMNIILSEVPNVESGCLRVIKRVSLSKRAKNTTKALAQYLQNSNYNNVSVPSLPRFAPTLPIATTHVDRFASRANIEEDIMKTLRDEEDVSMIGIFGMVGIGKTTMAERIMARALEEHVFQEVVAVVVGTEVDELEIQDEICESLGLNNPYEETWQSRVQKLHARLATGRKRILLVLDDVWQRLDLENLGIPCGSKGCTILITSRNSDALSAMNVKKIFRMDQLSEEEAWVLFRENVGTCVDNLHLSYIAKQVVKHCGGLPLALRHLASELEDEMSLSVWKNVLNQLTKPNPNDNPSSIFGVLFKSLLFSYESLDSKEAKSLLLLCCLFPRDYKIQVEQLTCFSIGLRIFDGMESLEEVRIRICALIKMLKSRSLLLDDHIDDHVRMHVLVRYLCMLIAKGEGYIGGNNCTWISSLQLQEEDTDLPTVLKFPSLRLLFSRELELKIDNTFFEGIKGLSVLSLDNYSWTLLPHSTQTLKELKTLILNSCWGLETISVVGELVNLEILICCECGSLKELPTEIRGLNHLKSLELSRCGNLQSIGPGIISSLTGLQKLKMLGSFNKWEVGEDTERQKNAGLRELDSLTNLTFLEIEIRDPALAAEEMHLSSKSKKFDFRTLVDLRIISKGYKSEVRLHWERGTFVGIKGLYELSLENYSWTLLPHSTQTLKQLKTLILNSCWELETISVVGELVNLEILICCECGSLKELPTEIRGLNHLKSLELSRCGNLQSIGPGIISSLTGLQELKMLGSFNKWEVGEDTVRQKNAGLRELDSLTNLTFLEIEIQDPALAAEEMHLSSKSKKFDIRTLVDLCIISKGCNSEMRFHWERENNLDLKKFPNIQRLQLGNYQTLKNIVRASMYDYDKRYGDATVFPLIENLHLFSLPELEYIWNIGWLLSSNSFKNFKKIRLEFLPALEQLWSSSDSPYQINKEIQLEFLPALKQFWSSSDSPYQINFVSYFSQLSSICIYGCQRLWSLFSLSMTKEGPCLPQLERLDIENCDMMEHVFFWNEELKTKRNDHITLVFPKLKFLSLCFLPKLTNFCEGIERVEFPLLPQMKIVNCPKLKKYAHSHEKRILINTSTSVRHQRDKDTNNALEQRRLGAEEKGKMRMEDSSNEDRRPRIAETSGIK